MIQTWFITFELNVVLVTLYASSENWFGVDAVATRHNSAFLNLKNQIQAGFLAAESAKRRKIDCNRRDLFVAFGP